MKNEWYAVKGTTNFRDEQVHLVKADLLVQASSIEEACIKAREFLKPVADFIPTKTEWRGKCG